MIQRECEWDFFVLFCPRVLLCFDCMLVLGLLQFACIFTLGLMSYRHLAIVHVISPSLICIALEAYIDSTIIHHLRYTPHQCATKEVSSQFSPMAFNLLLRLRDPIWRILKRTYKGCRRQPNGCVTIPASLLAYSPPL
jgi:hypothetical protein